MRARYRFHACPVDACPKLGGKGSRCPEHDREMVEVILRRETDEAKATATAAKLREAAQKVGAAAGKPNPDPFGIGEMFRGMADDIEAGRPMTDRHGQPFDHDADDDDIEEDDD